MLYFFGLYVYSKVWSNTKLEFQEKFKFQRQKSDIDLEFWKKEIFRVYFFFPNVMGQWKFPVPKIYNEF